MFDISKVVLFWVAARTYTLKLLWLPYESDRSYIEADRQKDSFGLEVLGQSSNQDYFK